VGAEKVWVIGSRWTDQTAIGQRRCSDDSGPRMVLFGWLWFLSGAHQVVSGKGWSLPDATHCMPRSGGGREKTTFIGQVLLSLVSCAIRATIVRSSGSDLTVEINRACLVDRVKRGPSDRRWRHTEVRDVLEKYAEGAHDRKVRFYGAFWVNLFKVKVEEGFVMKRGLG